MDNSQTVFGENNASLCYYKTPQLIEASKADYKNPFFNTSINESLPHNFERFALNSTPNYYVERSEFMSKPIEQSTPSKSANKYSKFNEKLGSPEINEILYPKIKHFQSSRNKTPQKLGKTFKTYSPAKKRLFEGKAEKVDPVTFFVNDKRNYSDVLMKILLYLRESDLYSFKRVSSRWKRALESDERNSIRYNHYIRTLKLDKENLYKSSANSQKHLVEEETKLSTLSPRKRKFNEFVEVISHNNTMYNVLKQRFFFIVQIGKTLKPEQSMNKCPKCASPAIVERSISQCQKSMCGYISCLNCNSFSTTGPENFADKCKSSMLVFDKPKIVRRLTDSPPKEIDPNQLPFFLRDATNTHLDDGSPEKKSRVLLKQEKRRSSSNFNILQSCNRDIETVSQRLESKPPMVAVLPCREREIENIIEPSSPPKISNVACSEQSKKRIKRRLVI